MYFVKDLRGGGSQQLGGWLDLLELMGFCPYLHNCTTDTSQFSHDIWSLLDPLYSSIGGEEDYNRQIL